MKLFGSLTWDPGLIAVHAAMWFSSTMIGFFLGDTRRASRAGRLASDALRAPAAFMTRGAPTAWGG